MLSSASVESSLQITFASQIQSNNSGDGVIEFADYLATQLSNKCLKVSVGAHWPGDSHVHILDDGNGSELMEKFRESLLGISQHDCMMLLFDKPPSDEMFEALNPRGGTDRYFMINFESKHELVDTLKSDKWKDEEHVLGILRTESSTESDTKFESYNRILFTPKGNRNIIRVATWRLGDNITFLHDPYPEQMKNFYGITMNASHLVFRPFTDYTTIPGELL